MNNFQKGFAIFFAAAIFGLIFRFVPLGYSLGIVPMIGIILAFLLAFSPILLMLYMPFKKKPFSKRGKFFLAIFFGVLFLGILITAISTQ